MLRNLLRSAFGPRANADTLVDRSLALRRDGRLRDAERLLREAAQKFPSDPIVATNLGIVLLEQDQGQEGVASLERALEIDSRYAPAHYNLANIMRASGRRADAVEHYQAAVDADAGFAHAREELMNCLLEVCDWDRADRVAAELRATINDKTDGQWMKGLSPLTAVRLGLAPAQVKAVSAYHAVEAARGIVPVRRDIVVDARLPPRAARLRIGYLSRDFRDHAVGHVLAHVFALHDRARFEVFAFSYGVDDKSSYRKAIESGVDRFIDAHGMTDGELAAVIAAAGIHILIDLAGHTTGNRMAVLARRPAPVQAHYLGFAATTGAPYIDYFITDKIATPPGQAVAFSENLSYVAQCFMVSDGSEAPDAVARVAAMADADLTAETMVYCNFNAASRIDRDDFAAWMEILRGVPDSVLWLQGANELTGRNLRAAATACAINPARLIFARRVPTKREHLKRLSRADLMLDTIGWHTGHSSTSDALWAGVPVLTVPGNHFANRVAASLVSAAGLPEFVRHDRADYMHKAIELGHDRAALAMNKRNLAERTAAFFNTQKGVKELETAYLQMWDAGSDELHREAR
jgi:predicted O-linked N-acetylglucosamine transferase (SPINDLY family)